MIAKQPQKLVADTDVSLTSAAQENELDLSSGENRTDGGPGGGGPDRRTEQHSAAAMGENLAWLESHQAELLQQHPDWAHKYVAVASRAPSKILAVADGRDLALEQALGSP